MVMKRRKLEEEERNLAMEELGAEGKADAKEFEMDKELWEEERTTKLGCDGEVRSGEAGPPE